MQVSDQLQPAETALDDAAALIQPMKPQLEKLKNVLQDGSNLAQDAQNSADSAADEADLVNQVSFLKNTTNNCHVVNLLQLYFLLLQFSIYIFSIFC